jgi:cytoskeletal protein CcmA (bactofilin family)
VYAVIINTRETENAQLPKGTFKPGWYLVEAVTIDKDGREIKDVRYIQLFSRKEGQFKGSTYLFTSVDNKIVKPGSRASFYIGSSAKDVHIIQEVQHKPKEKPGRP